MDAQEKKTKQLGTEKYKGLSTKLNVLKTKINYRDIKIRSKGIICTRYL